MVSRLPLFSRSVRGFTLVEALVALLVLSMGLLGVAGMQLKALQSAHVGYQRSIASLAAQDAVERLWANLNVDGSNYTCPDNSVVNGEKGDWVSHWREFLPGLDGSPIGEPSSDCVYEITLHWNDDRFRVEAEDGELSQEDVSDLKYTARLLGVYSVE